MSRNLWCLLSFGSGSGSRLLGICWLCLIACGREKSASVNSTNPLPLAMVSVREYSPFCRLWIKPSVPLCCRRIAVVMQTIWRWAVLGRAPDFWRKGLETLWEGEWVRLVKISQVGHPGTATAQVGPAGGTAASQPEFLNRFLAGDFRFPTFFLVSIRGFTVPSDASQNSRVRYVQT